ncbi:MAG TPA: TonB family protein [Terriglobales bacterium]|nr:TonB family protein [Terriglobales bacterium]
MITGLLFRLASAQQNAAEYQVKAAYLYNFAKLTHWPDQALPPRSNLVLCVLGGDEQFSIVLRETLSGKNVNGHAVEIRRSRSTEELKFCNMVFLREPIRNPASIIASLSNDVLLVGETKEFLAAGGMISLEFVNGKISYELNPAALEHSNVRYEPPGSTQNSPGDPVSSVQSETVRSIKSRVLPEYPDIAAKMKILGTVQVRAVVRADGTVKKVHVVGGHPVLAEAAVRAVMQWRFEPGPRETTESLKINFGP